MDNLKKQFINSIMGLVHQNPDGSYGGGLIDAGKAIGNNPVAKFFLNSAMNSAHDIGAGINAEMTQGARNSADTQAENQAQNLENQAYATNDMQQRVNLLKQASYLRQQVSNENKDVASTFSPDINKNYAQRSLQSGAEIGTTADMIAHPVQTLRGLGETAKAVLHPIQTARAAADTLTHLPDIIEGIPNALKDEVSNPDNFKLVSKDNPITKLGNRVLATQFKGAGKVVNSPSETIGKLADYGITTPQQVDDASAALTGKEGLFSKKVNQAVSSADEVDTNGVLDLAKNSLNSATKASPSNKKNAYNFIKNGVQEMLNSGVSDGDPEKTFQFIQDLGEQQAEHMKSPDLEDRQLAKVYGNVRQELENRLFTGATNDPNETRMGANSFRFTDSFTPDEIAQLRKMGGDKLVNDALSAQTTPQMRSLQAQFVNGSKMVSADEKAANGAVNIPQAITTTGAAMSGNPLLIAATGAQTKPGLNLTGKALRLAGAASGGEAQTGLDVAGLAHDYLSNPISQNNQENNPEQDSENHSVPSVVSISNNISPVNYNDIPQDVTQIKPDASGRYTITSPTQIIGKDRTPLAMSEDDYKNKKSQLLGELGTLSVKYNPQLSSQKQAELSQLEAAHDLSTKAQGGYSEAMKAANAVNTAVQMLSQAPPNILNDNPSIDKLNKAFNGKYAALAQQLQILQKYYPVMTDSVLKSASTGNALQVLGQVSNQIAQDYYQGINSLTGNVPGSPPQTQIPQQTYQGPAPLNGASVSGGGSVQGHPLAAF